MPIRALFQFFCVNTDELAIYDYLKCFTIILVVSLDAMAALHELCNRNDEISANLFTAKRAADAEQLVLPPRA